MNIKHLLKIIILINCSFIDFYNYNGLMLYVYDKEDLSSLKKKKQYIRKINKYISICRQGVEFDTFNKNITGLIQINALIPVFNSSKSIKSTIISIQKQKMENIEILLVDDNSSDGTIDILENLQKKDIRIKIIKNKFNKGTLYSRSLGALSSKGKYIMSIDDDDLFLNNIFKICYNESEKTSIDIIKFSGFESESNIFNLQSFDNIPFYSRNKSNNIKILQPQLSTFIFKKENENYILIDAYIWGKSINSFIYKKAIKLIGKEILDSSICWSEDRIVNFALFQICKIIYICIIFIFISLNIFFPIF